MAHAIAHRGPDHEGFFADTRCALASRRLSIIDLAGGNQPIVHDGQTLVFNGEIYNFREIRAELATLGHSFTTNSDSEVILKAYRQWQNQCLLKFRGMFAFAIWDSTAQRIFLARDRMGKKPLFYTFLDDGTLIFASEIKSILLYPGVERTLNVLAMDRMLDYGFNLSPSTFFKGIRQLPPAHHATYDERGWNIQSYWELDLTRPVLQISEEEAAEGLREHITGAVRDRLVSDVPVASYLSGGIDSSCITGIYASLSDQPVHSLSITFDEAGYDERHFALMVSKAFATSHHEFKCTIQESQIPDLVWFLETPLVTLLNLPLFLLSREIRNMGFKVVLSGDGADEILGGYDYFKLIKFMHFMNRQETPFRANLLRRIYPQLTSFTAWHQYQVMKCTPNPHPALPYRFQAFQLKEQLYSDNFLERLHPELSRRQDDIPQVTGSRPILDQALFLESRMRLPNLTLPLADSMSMANSVELRSPFMDHRLVEYVFQLPAQYKMRGLQEKFLLKKSFRQFLPPEICARKKQPLAPPSKWFVKSFRPMFGDVLSAQATLRKGYFRPEFIDFMFREFDSESTMDYSGVLVVAFFVHLWDELFLGPTRRSVGC